jgi:uncharacterized membrane protein
MNGIYLCFAASSDMHAAMDAERVVVIGKFFVVVLTLLCFYIRKRESTSVLPAMLRLPT